MNIDLGGSCIRRRILFVIGPLANEAAVLRDLAALLLWEYRSGPFSVCALISSSSNSD